MSADDIEGLLRRVVRFADGPGVRAIVLLGSLARGEASSWSDVDVERWFSRDRERAERAPRFIDGRLVIVSSRTVENVRGELRSAEQAIWAVPAYRAMRVLVDRRGDASAIRAVAMSFDWRSVRQDARRAARVIIAKSSEFVLKIRAATERRDEWAALHAARALAGRSVRAVAIARGIFIPTENDYYRLVSESAGPEWTTEFRRCFGLEGGDAFAQATATCRLYGETVRILRESLDAKTRAIADRALRVARS